MTDYIKMLIIKNLKDNYNYQRINQVVKLWNHKNQKLIMVNYFMKKG